MVSTVALEENPLRVILPVATRPAAIVDVSILLSVVPVAVVEVTSPRGIGLPHAMPTRIVHGFLFFGLPFGFDGYAVL